MIVRSVSVVVKRQPQRSSSPSSLFSSLHFSSASSYYTTILQRVQQYGLPKLTIQNIHRMIGRTNNNITNSATTSCTAFSCVDLCQYCYTLAKVGDRIWHLNAYESIVDHETIIQQATAADERRRQQRSTSSSGCIESPILLDGIPISIKANIATATQPYTAGSRILGATGTGVCKSNNSTANVDHTTTANDNNSTTTTIVGYDADVTTQLLHHSNAILIGTTTMDEFGMGSLGTNTATTTSVEPMNVQSKTNINSLLLPKNPIPFLYPSDPNMTHGAVEPWNDQNVIEFIQLPEEAIYSLHYDLLQPLRLVHQEDHHDHRDDMLLRMNTDEHRPDTNDQSVRKHIDDVTMNEYHYSPGGSSCGSAISVRHGSAIVSIGSDTGGSIRLPASYNNVVGYKPSYGIVSRYGLIPYANSFDTIGIIGNTTHCIATTYQHLIRGNRITDNSYNGVRDDENNDNINSMDGAYVVRDSTQSNLSSEYVDSIRDVSIRLSTVKTTFDNFRHQNKNDANQNNSMDQTVLNHQDQPLKGIKIGIPEAFSMQECSLNVRTAWEDCAKWLQQYGATVGVVTKEQISPSLIQQSLASYYILVCAEASSNLLRYDGFRYGASIPMNVDDFVITDDANNTGHTTLSIIEQQFANTRTNLLGKEVIRRILCGTYVLSADQYQAYYEQAAKIRAQITKQFTNTFIQYDLLMLPTTLYPPPKIYSDTMASTRIDPTEMLANDIMTVPISLTGCPAISVSIHGSSWYNAQLDEHQHPNSDDKTRSLLPPFQISMQLVGPRFNEPNMLIAASILEQYTATTKQTLNEME